MASRSLGSLTLDLIAQIAGFQEGMTKAQRATAAAMSSMEKSIRGFKNTFESVLAAVGVGFSVDAVVKGLQDTIEAMDQLGKSAQKVGLPVEQFSDLAAAASMAGIQVDDLTKLLTNISKAEGAATNPASQQAKIFSALGISVKDASGNLKSSQDILLEFSDKLKDLGVNSTTVAAGMALFGKNFQAAIPFMQQGSEAIKEAEAQAAAMGATLSGPAAKAAAEFDDKISLLKTAFTGMKNQLAIDLLPTLTDWANDIVGLVKNHQNLDSVASGVSNTLYSLAAVGLAVGAAFKVIEAAVETITTAIATQIKLYGDAFAVLKNPLSASAYKQFYISAVSDTKAAADQISDSWSSAMKDASKYFSAAGDQINKIGAQTKQATTSAVTNTTNQTKTYTAQQQAMMKALQNALNTGSADAAAAARKAADAMQALNDMVAKLGESTDPANAALNKLAATERTLAEAGAKAIQAGNSVARVQAAVAKGIAAAQKQYQLDLATPMKAAQNYEAALQSQLATKQQEIDLQIQGMTIGDKQAQQMQQLAQIAAQGAKAIADFQKQYQDSVAKGHPNATSQQYDAELSSLKSYWDNVYKVTQDGQAKINAIQSSFQDGMKKGMANFIEQMNDQYSQGQQFIQNFASGFSDAFSQWASGAESASKAFGSFIDSLFADALKFVANQAVKQLFSWLGGDSTTQTFDSSALTNGFNIGGGSSGSGGGFWSGVASVFASIFGGGKAAGGMVAANMLYRVNEHGPEMLSVGGQDYLMMGSNAGYVSPNNEGGAPMPQRNITINQMLQPTSTRQTADQVATATERRLRMSFARNS